VIELRSDTFTLPTPAMRAAMAAARVGDDVYGEDPTVRRLEELAAHLLGMEAACLMPSGTMANLAALLAHAPRGSAVVVGDETDIYLYEAGGASVCGGLVYRPVPTAPDGTLPLAALAAACSDDPTDPQFAMPAVVCLENTHNRCGGAVLPLSYLAQVRRFSDEHGLPLHIDGARLFNAAVALDIPAADIAGYADSVQFCLSKGLSAPVGSMLAGGAGFVARARRVRKMLGGGMRQAGVLAAAGVVALEQMRDRLAIDHANARRLAAALEGVPELELAAPVQTNIVLLRLRDPRLTWQRVVATARQAGLAIGELGHGRLRAVTHAGVTGDDMDRAAEILAAVLRTPAETRRAGAAA
jgi:threonine aldolase